MALALGDEPRAVKEVVMTNVVYTHKEEIVKRIKLCECQTLDGMQNLKMPYL